MTTSGKSVEIISWNMALFSGVYEDGHRLEGMASAAYAFSNLRQKPHRRYDRIMATAFSTQHSAGYSRKRRWERSKIDVPIRLIFWNSLHTAKIVDARGRDMSEGGMAIFAGVELRIGDIIEIEFTPAYSGQPLRVKAEVRNRRGYSYGIEFLNDTSDEQNQSARLRELLSSGTGHTKI
jgi:PilZ domain